MNAMVNETAVVITGTEHAASVGTFSTSQLCERYRRDYRTIGRWTKFKRNPFPKPITSGGGGAESCYSVMAVLAWEARGGLNPTQE